MFAALSHDPLKTHCTPFISHMIVLIIGSSMELILSCNLLHAANTVLRQVNSLSRYRDVLLLSTIQS